MLESLRKIGIIFLIGVLCIGGSYFNLFIRRAAILFWEEPYPARKDICLEKHLKDKQMLSHTPDGAVIICGDSLMDFWLRDAPDSWERLMAPLGCANVATDGDTIGNLRWRIRDGLFGHLKPSMVVICIGTNNISMNAPDWLVFRGLKDLVGELRERFDESVSLVLIPPFNAGENTSMEGFRGKMMKEPWGRNIFICPLYKDLQEENLIRAKHEYMEDSVHLSRAGYERIALSLSRFIKNKREAAPSGRCGQ